MRATLLVLIVIFSAYSAFAAKPTDQQLEKFFALKGAPAAYESVVSSIYEPMIAVMESGTVKVKNKNKAATISGYVKDAFTWENMKPEIYEFYKKHYTSAEIAAYIKLLERPDYRVMMKKEEALSDKYGDMLAGATLKTMFQIILKVQMEKALGK